ncbi:hypothetical protein V490_02724 [Pseudogymnoascus sp. VKM F-3557]|nr:hypothetical protein V490_02724 [Pseudogymnoascus sp. VKM F-3557]
MVSPDGSVLKARLESDASWFLGPATSGMDQSVWLEKNRPILHYQAVRAADSCLAADVAAGVELFPGGDGGVPRSCWWSRGKSG